MLGLLGAAAAVALVGFGQRSSAATATPACVVRPYQTEGPYFVDEKLNRSDIRSDPSDGSVRPGAPLRLALQVSRTDGRSCAPLTGALVDLWQCDALGVYSDVRDRDGLFSTRGKKFLRGYKEQPNFSRSIPAGIRGEPCTITLKFAPILHPDRAMNSLLSFTSTNP